MTNGSTLSPRSHTGGADEGIEVLSVGRDRRVNAVMTPRTQLEWLDLQDDRDENLRKVRESDYSRFPVFDGGPQQVVGIVQVKDILTAEVACKPLRR